MGIEVLGRWRGWVSSERAALARVSAFEFSTWGLNNSPGYRTSVTWGLDVSPEAWTFRLSPTLPTWWPTFHL